MKALLCGLAVLVLPGMAFAGGGVKTLESVDMFAFGGVGYVAKITEGELAFREVYAGALAKKDFQGLAKSRNPQAVCYGLVALRKLDPETCAVLAGLRKSKTDVTTAGGCMISKQPMASIVASIDSGAYDRDLP